MKESYNVEEKIAGIKQFAKFLMDDESTYDLNKLAEFALTWSASPLFLNRLKETNQLLTDAKQIKSLEKKTLSWKLVHLLQTHCMLNIDQSLAQAGIKCIWLKGATLGYLLYPEAYLRPKSDLDCLVMEADLNAALEIFTSSDYAIITYENRIETIDQDRLWHHIEFKHVQHDSVEIELHRHLLAKSGLVLLPQNHLEKWIEQSIDVEINNQTVSTLRHEYHFLYLCAHAFLQHGESEIGFLQLLDIHRLITSFDLDWEFIIAEATTLKWEFLLSYSLKRIQEYFGSIPQGAVSATLDTRVSKHNSIDFEILWQQQAFQKEYTYLNQLNFRERITTILQLTFPSKKFMRARYNIPRGYMIMPYYFYRVFKLIVALLNHLLIHIQKILK